MKNTSIILSILLAACICSCANNSDQTNNECSKEEHTISSNENESSLEPESKIFDISSLNGKTFYKYYSDDNEVRIPSVELPHTFTLPEGISAHSFMMFYWIEIKDCKVYIEGTDFSSRENTVTYSLLEEEIPLTILDNRYFTRDGEIVFSEDIIYIWGDFYVSQKFITENNVGIYTLENQYQSWINSGILEKVIEQVEYYFENIRTFFPSSSETSFKLPSKLTCNSEDQSIEVSISYLKVEPEENYGLEENVLIFKTDERPDGSLTISIDYQGETRTRTINF